MLRSGLSLSRLWQIYRTMRRHGLGNLLEDLSLSPAAHRGIRLLFGKGDSDKPRGQRIREALEELGPVFIKLGQALSTRPDILPADIALELAKLQDQVPPFSGEHAVKIIKSIYGDQFDDIFEHLDTDPMASASVAQVHSATLKPGLAIEGKNGKKSSEVIIKVIRPGIEKIINNDLRVMYFLAGLLQKHWSRGELLKPVEVIGEYDTTIHDELDLRREAANCSQMGANFIDSDIIYVPQVYWDYTHDKVMVMERIYGTPIREMETLKAKGYDMERLGRDGVAVFFKQAFEDNFFHADMHGGNIFVSDQGRWIAIDFGIMGTLSHRDKHHLADNLMGFFNRDYRAIAEAHLRAGWIPPDTRVEEFESAMRTVCEPNFAKPISEISFGVVLMQMLEVTQRFRMPVQPQLVLLYKTLLNIEGLGRQLYPELNLWDTAKPFLEEWAKKQTDPKTLLAQFQQDLPRWATLLPELPDRVMQSLDTDKHQHDVQQQFAQLRQELNQQQKTNTQQRLGLILSLTSVLGLLLQHYGVIHIEGLTSIAPWTALIGLALHWR